MTTRPSGGASIAPHAALVGHFSYRPDADAWSWSDGMFRIHGFEPGQVVPTMELVMSHIHPDDREAAWESREAALERDEPFSFVHRITTAAGCLRVVVAAGHLERHDETAAIVGHLIDITDVRQDAVARELDGAVEDFVEHRAVIEQAKGVLVQLYSVGPDTAWAILRAFSADSNRKVRDIAGLLVVAAGDNLTPTRGRSPSPHVMLQRLYADAPGTAAQSG
ncbi:ANTAR domain-containing protein [Nocardioides eburneiflavus]|uniref:histidine kinase n=1 Tax=Nocardioides eburneiflavus TaxID=2518372 RepID=A0A4Z1BYQ5_9ACTN|nr:PAS and ANTAR domain-containing protein [Nocardioides eburneiflavus]TGN62834.1 ANTAR domain-containing protein [Nocardioides eburneiflavus]